MSSESRENATQDNRSECSRSGKSTTSRASISVTLPTASTDLQRQSPVQVRGLSPDRGGNSPVSQPGSSVHPSRHGSRPVSHGAASVRTSRRGNSRGHSSQGTIPPLGTPTIDNRMQVLTERELEHLRAVRTIERAWLSYRDRQMFRLLKHSVCAAEHSLSYEILRKVSPREAEILKDKSIHTKIRFRFGGHEFPPLIFFKVFSSTEGGMGVKYVSGKKMIKPASEAARDACELMGHRLFYDQLIQDTIQQEEHRVTDEVDITTLKDFMQYTSFVDETPAYMGGRDNSWRQLTLEVLPRQTIFYDIVQFLYTHKMSSDLQSQIPQLLIQPVNEDMQLLHMDIIARLRSPNYTPHSIPASVQNTGRRTKQAQQRAQKMRQLYQQEKLTAVGQSKLSNVMPPPPTQEQTELYSSFVDGQRDPSTLVNTGFDRDLTTDPWDHEAQKLYEWTQELSMDELVATPRIATA